MTNKSGNIGTKGETAVVKYLQANGFPSAERSRLRGNKDVGDITGCPGLCWEVKAGKAAEQASDLVTYGWLIDTDVERRQRVADIGVLVVKRKGIGYPEAGRWWALMPLWAVLQLATGDSVWTNDTTPMRMRVSDAVRLLRRGGYGEPLVDDATAVELWLDEDSEVAS